MIDSGSGNLWVSDVDCVGCNVSDATLFNPDKSSSIVNIDTPIEILYGIGISFCRRR